MLRPVISEKSMDETHRNKYTFAVHDDANKLQIKAAVEAALQGHGAGRQRPDHASQGEEPQPQAWPRPGLDLALEEGHRHRRRRRQDRILRGGLADAAAQLQGDLSRPPVHDPLDVRGDHHRQAAQAAARIAEARQRAEQPGPPHRPPSWRWREAQLPAHRLQARQVGRAGEAGHDRVRPQPVGPHRAAPLP